jgi:hypothetical protein
MSDDLGPFEAFLARELKSRAGESLMGRDSTTAANEAIARSERERRSGIVPTTLVAALSVCVVVIAMPLLSGRGQPPQASSSGPSVATTPTATSAGPEEVGGLLVHVPPGWQVVRYVKGFSTSGLVGYISMVDVPAPCSGTGSSETCDRTPYSLTDNTAAILVETRGDPRRDPLTNPPAGVDIVMIDGMPAFRQADSSGNESADELVTWFVAMPGTIANYYQLTAEVRGPSAPPLVAAIDTMVTGMRFATAVVALQTDTASKQAAVGMALAELSKESSAYECVPREPGRERQATIDALPKTPASGAPLQVVCSFEVEPTLRQIWKMTVHITWDEDVNGAPGSLDVVAWLDRQGAVLGTQAAFGS